MFNINPEQKKIFNAKTINEREMLSQILLGKTFEEVRADFDNKFKESLVLDDNVFITSLEKLISSDGEQTLTIQLTHEFVGSFNAFGGLFNPEWMQFISGVEIHDMQFYSKPINQHISSTTRQFLFPSISPPRLTVVMRGKFSDDFIYKLQKKMNAYRN